MCTGKAEAMDDNQGMQPVSASTADEETQTGLHAVSPGAASSPSRHYLLHAFFFKTRGLMAGLLLFAMFFTIRGNWGSNVLNCAIGLPLFAFAVLLRIRSQQYLQYRLQNRSHLATAGPYAYVRNPVYIANMMGLGALCILCAVYWMAPIVVACMTVVYHLSVRFEEMRLLKCYGEQYRRYLECVPRWLPQRSATMVADNSHAGFWQAARVEWQNLLLLFVPLGKMWTFHSNDGSLHSVLYRLVSFVIDHNYLFLAIVGIGSVCLAAVNLRRLHSSQQKKAERTERRERSA